MGKVFFKSRFYFILSGIIALFLFSYAFSQLFLVSQLVLTGFAIVVVVDFIMLYNAKPKIEAKRELGEKLSLGDDQSIHYEIINQSAFELNGHLVDELPKQLQYRDSIAQFDLPKDRETEHNLTIRPTVRGVYYFGNLYVYISSSLFSLIEVACVFDLGEEIKVVPSVIQMKKYEMKVFSKTASASGVRKIRQLGENDEFEQIRAYAEGDNIKAINWKATSRLNKIMINQFQNSKSQNVYCLVDKGRSMKMPFDELTLLDHSINSALVISNIVLRKYDRAGLITFSNKMGAMIKAESRGSQLERIMDQLYKQKTAYHESSFELLNIAVRKKISRRSILILFTNFENQQDFQRNLPYLKALNKRHLLLVVFFINTALEETSEMPCKTEEDIYLQTFARRIMLEKELIKIELGSNGIQSILTKPNELSINVINRYLEFKAKRML